MALPSVFERTEKDKLIARIESLNRNSERLWGTMDPSTMLAHCNVTYELIYTDNHPKPGIIGRFFLKSFVKGSVVNEKPYSQNGRTGPQFLIKDTRDFDTEKNRLIQFVNRVFQDGKLSFDNKESHSFGKLSLVEWNNMMYKHLDHHLRQFNV